MLNFRSENSECCQYYVFWCNMISFAAGIGLSELFCFHIKQENNVVFMVFGRQLLNLVLQL